MYFIYLNLKHVFIYYEMNQFNSCGIPNMKSMVVDDSYNLTSTWASN